MRYLVTGAAGFIGSNLVRHLLNSGNEVVGLDNLSTGQRDNLQGLDFEFIEGSITEADTCRRALEGVDFVLHQAAVPSVPRSVADPLRSHDANVNGTITLLEAAREIQDALAQGAGPSEPPEGPLSGRVSTMIEDFETSHPRFAEILRSVSEALANLGI